LEGDLIKIYRLLLNQFGPQHWWPADTPFEVCVGAILTQNTAWHNVERAIINLKNNGLLSPRGLKNIAVEDLARYIKPAGYFNVKARRLKAFIDILWSEFQGSLEVMFSRDLATLRGILLEVPGIGPETADSILLYAGGYPIFVIDAYTKRIFSRHQLGPKDNRYEEWQRYFMEHLAPDTALFNEYHALLVRLGKDFCRKNPRCLECPLHVL
jgi:endonuclease-3 related protein